MKKRYIFTTLVVIGSIFSVFAMKRKLEEPQEARKKPRGRLSYIPEDELKGFKDNYLVRTRKNERPFVVAQMPVAFFEKKKILSIGSSVNPTEKVLRFYRILSFDKTPSVILQLLQLVPHNESYLTYKAVLNDTRSLKQLFFEKFFEKESNPIEFILNKTISGIKTYDHSNGFYTNIIVGEIFDQKLGKPLMIADGVYNLFDIKLSPSNEATESYLAFFQLRDGERTVLPQYMIYVVTKDKKNNKYHEVIIKGLFDETVRKSALFGKNFVDKYIEQYGIENIWLYAKENSTYYGQLFNFVKKAYETMR